MGYMPRSSGDYFSQWANFRPISGVNGPDASGNVPQPTGIPNFGGQNYGRNGGYFSRWGNFQPVLGDPYNGFDATPTAPKRGPSRFGPRPMMGQQTGQPMQQGIGQQPMQAGGQPPAQSAPYTLPMPQAMNTNGLGNFYNPSGPGDAQNVGNSTIGSNFIGNYMPGYAPRQQQGRTF